MAIGRGDSPAGLAAALLGALAAAPALAEDFFYRVEAAQLGCIIAHLDSYLASEEDLVLIVPEACPPTGETGLAGQLTNEAPDLTFSEEGALDPLLVLSPSQVACLAGVQVPPGEVVRLYPDLCRVEADGG